jgi:iron-sulfur cluster assembly accessory protein
MSSIVPLLSVDEHPPPLLLTAAAEQAVRDYFAAEGIPLAQAALRVSVTPGGCSGFQYALNVLASRDAVESDDITLTIADIVVVIDPFSAPYLRGTTVDYVRTISHSGFRFSNPNAAGGCGCGKSFGV